MEQQIERQNVELISLEALGQKLEELAAGPSTNKIKRDIENAINDWKVLSRDVRNVTAKHMQQVLNQFSSVHCPISKYVLALALLQPTPPCFIDFTAVFDSFDKKRFGGSWNAEVFQRRSFDP